MSAMVTTRRTRIFDGHAYKTYWSWISMTSPWNILSSIYIYLILSPSITRSVLRVTETDQAIYYGASCIYTCDQDAIG